MAVHVSATGGQRGGMGTDFFKVVHVPGAGGQRAWVDLNCIYYPKQYSPPFEGEHYMKRLDLRSWAVYFWDNKYICIT